MQVHFSSKTDLWSTPQNFFDKLDDEFNFTLDPCATPDNAKCDKYFTIEDDGLAQDWSNDIVFMNPPYGRAIRHWIKKAHEDLVQECKPEPEIECVCGEYGTEDCDKVWHMIMCGIDGYEQNLLKALEEK